MTSERGPTRKRVVVVVEDDRTIGELLETLKTIVPDLLVLDIGLPGMSGIELYDKIRQDERLRSVPVMFETAVSHEHRKEFRRRGIDTVIRKPFELDEILWCMHRLAPPFVRKRIGDRAGEHVH